jgi:FixJ family two-component response regulator
MFARQKTVVIVDDDPLILSALEQLLRSHGFVTEVYASAEAFLDSAALSNAICLVVDVHLGGISGIELNRQLAAAGLRPPIIFMTGASSETTKREATETGCIGYLHKPFPSERLIDLIKTLETS